ncbi:SidA/IucD/PvdA family monooxygenase (plasmid) [Cupriavidus metallidurans]|uniref:lysine N(6)-hydroxylase/L-ornithine N(5)-oxygenase family protein n=1 Tax=Cupriavidus metallidurans TaxID=119219 RepID=UPI003D740A15
MQVVLSALVSRDRYYLQKETLNVRGADTPQTNTVYDVIGIGFGPANIATAIAFSEQSSLINMLFFEASTEFSWHPGMLLEDTRMQVSFIKDLVSLRNPRSKYSFLNYLHSIGRLPDFTNLNTFYPSRAEFTAYLRWCAQDFREFVRYGHRVCRIEPHFGPEGDVNLLVVKSTGPQGNIEVLTRSVIHAGGLEPTLPDGIVPGSRILHGHDFINHFAADPPLPGASYVVVGAGQSAAEILRQIQRTMPASKVTSVVPRFGFIPADSSPFVNQIFDAESVNIFYYANPERRRSILDMHRTTNYGAVDADLIQDLYRHIYEEKVSGKDNTKIERLSYLVSARESLGKIEVLIKSIVNDSLKYLIADYLVLATGFRPRSVIPLLSTELKELIEYREDGSADFGRNYRLKFGPCVSASLYAVGMCESTHGLSATLISNMAVRAGEIAEEFLREKNFNLSNDIDENID